MAVKPAINALPSAPNMNKRWPPMADRTSLPYRLTTLSKQKLAREATAPDPDIRRCLSHFRLHVRSVEWTQNEMTAKINALDLESESESESEPEGEDHKDQPEDEKDSDEDETPSPQAATSDTKELPPTEISTGDKAVPEQNIHIHFEVTASAPSPGSSDKEGLLEKGRNCLEKTVQRKSFWPSPGQCMPVRIAG